MADRCVESLQPEIGRELCMVKGVEGICLHSNANSSIILRKGGGRCQVAAGHGQA